MCLCVGVWVCWGVEGSGHSKASIRTYPRITHTTPPHPTTACAKCVVGRCQISLSNFVKNPVTLELYCKTHYMAKFRVEGKYLGADEYARN